jgi:hypothetical protein
VTDTLLTFDPGKTTGWSLWCFDEDHPLQRLEYGLIKGGVHGFADWIEQHLGVMRPDVLICEKWDRDGRQFGRAEFSLPIEGLLIGACRALGLEITWQGTDMKALCKDSVLRASGLWLYGKDPEIDWEDARDVNDAQIHALAWAKAHGHEPTTSLFWPEYV